MKRTGWYLADVDVSNHAIPYTYIPEDFKLREGENFETLLPRYGKDRQPLKTGELFAHCLYSFFNFDSPRKAFGEILERLFEEAEKF